MSEKILNNSVDYLEIKQQFDLLLTEIDKGKTFTFVLPMGVTTDRNSPYNQFHRLNNEYGLITWRKDVFDPQQPKYDNHGAKVSMNCNGDCSELNITREGEVIVIRTRNYLCHCDRLRNEIYDLLNDEYQQVNEQYFSEKINL